MTRRPPAPGRSGRTPRGTLSAELILDAAIGVIDQLGVEGLTLSRVAERLGVTPMSLYTYFRDKDALLRGTIAVLYERLELPERTPGLPEPEYVRRLLRALFDLFIANPVLLRLDAASEGLTEPEARLFEELYAALFRMGFASREAIGTVAAFIRYVTGAAFVHRHRHQRDADEHYWERYRAHLARLSPRAFPTMHSLSSVLVELDQDETFEFGLEVLLEPLKHFEAPSTTD